jgi:LysR family transcriptional regulator, glycine cleavage system transcriptional activator
VVARLPLVDITDFILSRHTLLRVARMPRLWNDRLRPAGAIEVDQALALTFDHFYLAVQAALDGWALRMGPVALSLTIARPAASSHLSLT